MRWVFAFFRFWYDFIVGDDWLIAIGVIAAIAVTALIANRGVAAWWVMPLSVVALLAASLWRALRRDAHEHLRPSSPGGAAKAASARGVRPPPHTGGSVSD